MKKALVISLLVLVGLGAAAFAGPLSGKWCASFGFDYTEAENIQYLTISGFASTLELDYTACGWTFSSTADFNKHAFANLYFEAQGSVGAFGFYGILDFIPQTPNFHFMIGFVDVSIAGVNLYAGGGIQNFNTDVVNDPLMGVGWVVGGYGVAGDCGIWVEAEFNFAAFIHNVYWYGYETAIDRILYVSSTDCQEKKPGYNVQTASCCPCWLGLNAYVEYSFACFDVLTTVGFDCDVGFKSVCFTVTDICTGLDWLELNDLTLCFEVQTKSLCAQLELVLGDCVCFTPYISLVVQGAAITGIELNALTLEYDMGQGVTFKAGSFFDTSWGFTGIAKVGDTASCDTEYTYCWDSNGNIVKDLSTADCCIAPCYDEYFAILIDGDACCGGAFSVEVFNWFDDHLTTGFMDWAETEVDISIGIGSNTTLSFGFDLGQSGLLNWAAGVCFEW